MYKVNVKKLTWKLFKKYLECEKHSSVLTLLHFLSIPWTHHWSFIIRSLKFPRYLNNMVTLLCNRPHLRSHNCVFIISMCLFSIGQKFYHLTQSEDLLSTGLTDIQSIFPVPIFHLHSSVWPSIYPLSHSNVSFSHLFLMPCRQLIL